MNGIELAKRIRQHYDKKVLGQIVHDYEESRIYKLIVHDDDREELINIHEILYIEADKTRKGRLSFVLSEKTLSGRGSLKNWEQDLLPYNFLLCHRGILVNATHIHFFKGNSIILTNGVTLPLSRRQEKEIRALFSKRILTLDT